MSKLSRLSRIQELSEMVRVAADQYHAPGNDIHLILLAVQWTMEAVEELAYLVGGVED